MLKIKSILAVLTSIYLISCVTESSRYKKYVEITIDNTKMKDSLDISKMIEKITITPLFEKKDNHIGSIFKIYFSKQGYIVYDRISTNKILLFDRRGQLIKTVIKAGDGNQDPLNIGDCWLNEKGELEVYDFSQMKIFRFDSLFNLTAIIKSKLFNHFVSLIAIPSTKQYIGYANYADFNVPFNNKLYQIAFLDSNLDILKSDNNFEKSMQGVTWPIFNQHFYMYKNTVSFVKAYDNFVYTITNTDINKKIKITYKENNLPEDLMPIINPHLEAFKDRKLNPNIKADYFKAYCRFAGLWLESDRYILMSSKDTAGKFGTLFYTLLEKKGYKELFSAQMLFEASKYRLQIPSIQYYDEINNEYVSVTDGSRLKSLLFKDSPFQEKVENDPTIFYIVKIKLR